MHVNSGHARVYLFLFGVDRSGAVVILVHKLIKQNIANNRFLSSVNINTSISVLSRGGYMQTGTSQSLSGTMNRPNQMMQGGGGMQGAGAFGRRY